MRISQSQLNTWDRCQFKWYLSYRAGVEENGYRSLTLPSAMRTGSLGHTLLREFYKDQVEGKVTDPYQQAKSRAGEMLDLDGENAEATSLVLRVLKRYFDEQIPKDEREGWVPHLIETHHYTPFTTPHGNEFLFEFYPDLVMLHQPTNRYWLWDHKWTGNLQNMWGEHELNMNRQFTLFSLGLAELPENPIEVHGCIVNQFNFYPYKDWAATPTEKVLVRKPLYRTAEELLTAKVELLNAVDELVAKEINNGPYRRQPDRTCNFCQFYDPCLLSSKGLPLLEILDSQFEAKPLRPEGSSYNAERLNA